MFCLFCSIGNDNRPGLAKGTPIMLFTDQDGLPEYASIHTTQAESCQRQAFSVLTLFCLAKNRLWPTVGVPR